MNARLILNVLLAHKQIVIAGIAALILIMYTMPLDSISEVFAAKGGVKGPPTPLPDEGNHYGWVKKGGPPPQPK
jgi:hypothetical protein